MPVPVPSASPSASPRATVPAVPIQGTEPALAAAEPAPVRVRVPAVGIDVAVDPVGVLDTGAMELPERVSVAGWYRFGPGPASAAGSTILAAHVDSLKYGRGPFSLLKDAPLGAAVSVTTADGVEHAYAIAISERVAKQEIPLEAVFDRAGAPRLVLITCGGQFDHETGHYLDNILITATPVAG